VVALYTSATQLHSTRRQVELSCVTINQAFMCVYMCVYACMRVARVSVCVWSKFWTDFEGRIYCADAGMCVCPEF